MIGNNILEVVIGHVVLNVWYSTERMKKRANWQGSFGKHRK